MATICWALVAGQPIRPGEGQMTRGWSYPPRGHRRSRGAPRGRTRRDGACHSGCEGERIAAAVVFVDADGCAFYAAMGFDTIGPVTIPLGTAIDFDAVEMERMLSRAISRVGAAVPMRPHAAQVSQRLWHAHLHGPDRLSSLSQCRLRPE